MTMTNEALSSNRRLSAEPAHRVHGSPASGERRRQEVRADARPRQRVELPSNARALFDRPPTTIAGWKAVADGLLSSPCCAFHRNAEISSCYAWIYGHQPECFKWAAMAAIRVSPHPSRPLPAPAGHRSHRLRGHPARPPSQPVPADEGREHHPRDEQRHLRRHLLGSPRVRHCRRRGRTSTRAPASRQALRTHPRRLRGARPRSPCLGTRAGGHGSAPDRGRAHLGGQRPAPRARAARLGATEFRSPLVRIRAARLDGFRNQLRGERGAASGDVLHVVLPVLPHPRRPRCRARADVAADHSLRRPVALARRERRSLLPELRLRHAPGRRQPATLSSTKRARPR